MLPQGTRVVASVKGVSASGDVVMEIGSPSDPVQIAIGDPALSAHVSTALATMEIGEVRQVKAPYRRRGQKPGVATFEVRLADIVRLTSVEDEAAHGEECACGCHEIRRALSKREAISECA